jgi:hypothetical protein
VDVRVDHRRHHRLAGQIDVHRARRHRDRALASDRRDAAALHDQRAVVDRRARVADDQARAFVDDRAAARGLRQRDNRRQRDRAADEPQRVQGHGSIA